MSAFLQDFETWLQPDLTLSGYSQGAAAWALSRTDLSGGPLLVVVPEPDDVQPLIDAVHTLSRDGRRVEELAADDVRPYDGLSPRPKVVQRRLAALDLLGRRAPGVVVAPARALAQRVLAPEVLQALVTVVKVGDVVDRDALVGRLVSQGYLVAAKVEEPGTAATRGSVLDIWPSGEADAVRLELFADEVDEIRVLDPVTQRSGAHLGRVRLLPAREAVLSPEAISRAARVLAQQVGDLDSGHAVRRRALEEWRSGLWFPGAEDYLPALHEVTSPLDLASRVLVLDSGAVGRALDHFADRVKVRWAALDPEDRPPVPPELRFDDPDLVRHHLGRATRWEPIAPDAPDLCTRDNSDLQCRDADLAPLVGTLAGWLDEQWQVVLVCESRARAERLRALIEPHGLEPVACEPGHLPAPGTLGLWVGDLALGFRSSLSRLAVVVEGDLFGRRAARRRVPATLREAALSSHAELAQGDLVVHALHGIGRFEGLDRLDVRGVQQDFVRIRYRDDDLLYLPVHRLEQLYKYRSVGDRVPRLDKLGGETWARRRQKVRDKVLAMAHEILRTHAARTVVQGHAYEGRPVLLQQFEELFEFVETPDQETAIDDVLADLAQPTPMDRLLVGDVGFGKTEVAMRAAMRVVIEGHQVVVLCPTTVLAYQHYRTFSERFEPFAGRVELLSRFRTPAQTRDVLADTASGKVDILIGTHAVLGRKLRFKRLGLAVVDEEHRFGVRQKEKLLKLTTGVDVLAMSATPIPRTLHMALSGLRKVSLIATPPSDRLAVKVELSRFDPERIRQGILYELGRGGQVYFVHNRVASIEPLAERLRKLVPEATIIVGHGQMEAEQLEEVLVDFIRRRAHVLVCTTIIESGIDLPNVNTMYINRADRFGLAQLYQLRGRVGRGGVQAHCTLLAPEGGQLTRDAMRRLQVLQEHTELGAGFSIASADLELRGAGNLLGEAQHGHMQAVGLDTYVDLLEEAVAEAGGLLARERLDPEVEVPVSALLPETYVPDVDERLHEYRRLAVARTVAEVRDLVDSWEEVYGEPPAEVLNLGWHAEAKVRCRALGIRRLTWLKVRAALEFDESTTVSPAGIARLLAAEGSRFSMPEPERLVVRFTPAEAEWPFRFLHWVFVQLEKIAQPAK